MHIIRVEVSVRQIFIPRHQCPAAERRLADASQEAFRVDEQDIQEPLANALSALDRVRRGYSGVVLRGCETDLGYIAASLVQEPPLPVDEERQLTVGEYRDYLTDPDELSLQQPHTVQSAEYPDALLMDVSRPDESKL